MGIFFQFQIMNSKVKEKVEVKVIPYNHPPTCPCGCNGGKLDFFEVRGEGERVLYWRNERLWEGNGWGKNLKRV